MREVAPGTVVPLRFATTTRELTPDELATYLAGGGLPGGVGKDTAGVLAEIEEPGLPAATTAVTKDATGAYHINYAVPAGLTRWRAVAAGVALTPWYEVKGGEGEEEGSVAELVESVIEDGQFDATKTQVLRWLNQRHRQMVARAKCYRKANTVGSTVAGTSSYRLPAGIIEILQVTVGGYVFGHARHQDFAEGELGYLWLGGIGGIAGRDDTAAGESTLRLFPAPTNGVVPVPGSTITVYAAMQPPALTIGDDSAIKVPDDYLDVLVSGAIATGMLRMESRADMAAPHLEAFNEGCRELIRATNRKYRGSGPAQIRVVGINA